MFNSLRECIEFFNDNFGSIKTSGNLTINNTKFEIKFDPDSYNQVLLFLITRNNVTELTFAATEFGLYIREDECEDVSLYFYHTLLSSNIFELGPITLGNVFYMFKQMQLRQT